LSYYPGQQASFGPNPDDLDAPLYGATIGQAFTRFWKKYATFSGRASRSEYWWFTLIGFVVGVVTTLIDVVAAGSFAEANANVTGLGDMLSYVWALATLVPSLALGVRRLHDTNRSGWWLLIVLVPLVGAIVLLVFYLTGPNPAGARFDRAGTPRYGAYAGQPQA
jgi:uncharacterized membrane protein YhaH (DUF805 family)